MTKTLGYGGSSIKAIEDHAFSTATLAFDGTPGEPESTQGHRRPTGRPDASAPAQSPEREVKALLAVRAVDFVRRLPPEPNNRPEKALRGLADEKGDTKALKAPLEGYCRLRVGGYRIVFAYGNRATIECIFAEQRSVRLQVATAQFHDRIGGG